MLDLLIAQETRGLLGYLKAWESVVPLITSLLGQANGLRNTNL